MKNLILLWLVTLLAITATLAIPANAAEDQGATDKAAELAKKLSNPIANLSNLPIQYNLDFGIGPADAKRHFVNVQPVIPFSLNSEWILITRTIVPLVYAEAPAAGLDDHSGLGDIVQSFFLSPMKSIGGGWITGAGPVFLYPSATDSGLGSKKWGAGPTAVVLKQDSGWTYGILANHIWSFAGNDDYKDISNTFLQPFLSYTTKTYTTFSVNTESVYDWKAEQWTVPVNLMVSQLVKIDGVPIQFQLGGRYYFDKPDGGPDWGLRFAVTFMFPK
jgi:hypothetical protein